MKASLFVLFGLLLTTLFAFSASAVPHHSETAEASLIAGLPQAPLFVALGISPGAPTCGVIRALPNAAACNYFACEDIGCGAPQSYDPATCDCYCGYAF